MTTPDRLEHRESMDEVVEQFRREIAGLETSKARYEGELKALESREPPTDPEQESRRGDRRREAWRVAGNGPAYLHVCLGTSETTLKASD